VAHYFGLDIGSSFLKAAVLDVDALELRHVQRAAFPDFIEGLPPRHREVDPGSILEAVHGLLGNLVQCAPGCEGLVLCGQMHGFVLVNPSGEAVSNYVSWLDQRMTAAEFEELAALVTEGELRGLGNEFRPSIALSMLYWLKRRGELPDVAAMPVSLADYVAGKLCGVPPIMEPTQAAALGALRLGSLHWHRGVIDKLGLGSLGWPEVRPTEAVVGEWRGAPCFASVGDQQCALAGALLAEDELSVNIGTGSQVARITDALPDDDLQTRPYFDGRFLRTITHIPAGRALSALVGLFTELGDVADDEAWRKIERAVEAVATTDVHASIAFYPGPCGDRGFLENLHEGNLGVGPIFRAVFESMARNYAMCSSRLDTNRGAARMVFSGGVARRIPMIRELTATALGLPYRLSPHEEDTLFGLMVLALAFSGRHESVDAATKVVSARMGAVR
jgi:xylulokinase